MVDLAIYSTEEHVVFRELESELDAENRRFGDAQKVSETPLING